MSLRSLNGLIKSALRVNEQSQDFISDLANYVANTISPYPSVITSLLHALAFYRPEILEGQCPQEQPSTYDGLELTDKYLRFLK